MNLNNVFVKTLKEKGITVAFAESITCGMASHKLASCKGTADVLMGSVVCYTAKVKTDLLTVSQKLINTYSCESMQVTEALARKLPKLIKADMHAAITGLAADGGTESKEKPVGTVFICVKCKNKIFKEKRLFRGTPLQIREKACDALYELILSKVK